MDADPLDPKGLIRESYRIEDITEAECRSIFLDWALSHSEQNHTPLLNGLLERHAGAGDHPMTRVLRAGLASSATPTRRGGRRARLAAPQQDA